MCAEQDKGGFVRVRATRIETIVEHGKTNPWQCSCCCKGLKLNGGMTHVEEFDKRTPGKFICLSRT